ncbi:MAG TPA: response regulator [Candidatus Brocadiia bacterium]|nr:response regulator [Candidatus Brocadiia bacterium]
MDNAKILVADDEPFNLRALCFVLQKAGFQTIEARDGEEALERIRSDRPALVFLDIMMPVVDGYDVCAQVRANPELRGTRIIFLTCKGQEADRDKGMSLGADAYITKPFSPAEAVRVAREMIEGGRN